MPLRHAAYKQLSHLVFAFAKMWRVPASVFVCQARACLAGLLHALPALCICHGAEAGLSSQAEASVLGQRQAHFLREAPSGQGSVQELRGGKLA